MSEPHPPPFTLEVVDDIFEDQRPRSPRHSLSAILIDETIDGYRSDIDGYLALRAIRLKTTNYVTRSRPVMGRYLAAFEDLKTERAFGRSLRNATRQAEDTMAHVTYARNHLLSGEIRVLAEELAETQAYERDTRRHRHQLQIDRDQLELDRDRTEDERNHQRTLELLDRQHAFDLALVQSEADREQVSRAQDLGAQLSGLQAALYLLNQHHPDIKLSIELSKNKLAIDAYMKLASKADPAAQRQFAASVLPQFMATVQSNRDALGTYGELIS